MRGSEPKPGIRRFVGSFQRRAVAFAGMWLIATCTGCDGLISEEANLQEFIIDFSRQVVAALLF